MENTLPIDSRHQLFLDNDLVHRTLLVRRVVHQPVRHPGNPVLELDRPWETESCSIIPPASGTVLYDEEEHCFKMWYLAASGPDRDDLVFCYAVSDDGLSWEKPNLNRYEWRGSKANNICLAGYRNFPQPMVHKLPEERGGGYLMFFWGRTPSGFAKGERVGLIRATSTDGIVWEVDPRTNPVWPDIHDLQCIAYDSDLGKYVAFQRWTRGADLSAVPGYPDTLTGEGDQVWPPRPDHSVRMVARVESSDGLQWERFRWILEPDLDDPIHIQFYSMQGFPIHGIYVGLLEIFDERRLSLEYQLTTSRDGLNWSRVGNRKIFFPTGAHHAWDCEMVTIRTIPITLSDQLGNPREMRIYYTGSNWKHIHSTAPLATGRELGTRSKGASGVGVATLRPDGFVSLYGGETEGDVVTCPVRLTGAALFVNADASGGRLRVTLLDKSGKPIESHSEAECDPLHADKLFHAVSWNGNTHLGDLNGREIRLQFHLRKAHLYSFWTA